MGKKKSRAIEGGEKIAKKSKARSVAIARRGIRTGPDFADLMSALVSDVICGDLTPAVVNAACNAGGKLLKIAEMTAKRAPNAGPVQLASPN